VATLANGFGRRVALIRVACTARINLPRHDGDFGVRAMGLLLQPEWGLLLQPEWKEWPERGPN
jgi:hypothetical protein